MSIRVIGVVCVLLLAVGAFAATDEDLVSVTMEGRAPGKDKAARDEAILNAEQEIVLQAIEGMIPKPDLVALQPVLTHAPAYLVPSPKLTKYDQEGDSTRVEIEAMVRLETLKRDVAQAVLPRLQPPRRALALFAEQTSADAPLSTKQSSQADKAVEEALQEIGLDCADSASVRSLYAPADLLARLQGDATAIAQLARENLADIAIVGVAKLSAEAAKSGSNVMECKAAITLSIIRASDAKTVESKVVDAQVSSLHAAEGNAQAMEDACAKLKKEIGIPAVLAAAGAVPPEGVVVTVANPPQGDFAKEFLAALQSGPGVRSVDPVFLAPRVARYRVHHDGPMAQLVDLIASQGYGGVRLEVKRVVGREINLDVAGK